MRPYVSIGTKQAPSASSSGQPKAQSALSIPQEYHFIATGALVSGIDQSSSMKFMLDVFVP